jgi:pyroglutamyl-peptidase
MIRLERVGLNLASFEIPDNEGRLVGDEPVRANGAAAQMASLPLRAIEAALLAAGIPARLSETAGTFLCNATLYGFLSAAERRAPAMLCGFIHLPYLPAQVAELVQDLKREAVLERHQRADLASMDLATQLRAIEIAVEVSSGAAS